MAKKVSFIITADNNQAIKAMSEVGLQLNKINSTFKAQKKIAGAGSGSALDPKAMNVVGDQLSKINTIFKSMGVSQSRWERDAGFTNLTKGFNGVKDAASGLKSVVEGILPPLAALTGAASVAGIGALAVDFGKQAAAMRLSSYQTGVGVGPMQKWMNKGQAFGIDNDTMMSSIGGFAKVLQDAAFMRTPQSTAFFKQLGIDDLRNRRNDPMGVMQEAFQKLGGFDEKSRHAMLSSIGLDPFEKMFMYDPKETARRNAMAEQYGFNGSADQIAKMNQLEGDFNGLSLAISSVTKNLELKFQPFLSEVAKGLSDWLTQQNQTEPVPTFGTEQFGSDWFKDMGSMIFKDWRDWRGGMSEYDGSPGASGEWGDRKGDGATGSWEDRGSVFGEPTSSGISNDGPAPKESVVRIIHENVPKGTKIVTDPSPASPVINDINYAGFN